jgi:hypothetical protein
MSLLYEVRDRFTGASRGWLTEDGTLTGRPVVLDEPTFQFDMNVGPREVQLRLSLNPMDDPLNLRISEFDLVRITNVTDARVMGEWKYELASSGIDANGYAFVMHLLPLAAELTEVDFAGNYSSTADADNQPILGTATWDVPVVAAVPRTKHCSLVAHSSDGVAYAMTFAKQGAKVVDTLNNAIDQGGPDWWWYCDALGRVELAHGPRTTHVLAFLDDVITETKTWDATALINVQPVEGAPHADDVVVGGLSYTGAQVPYRAAAPHGQNTDPGSTYSTINLGRRVAPAWSDSTLASQAAVNGAADAILARRNRPITTYTLRLRQGCPRLVPGDQVTYTDKSGTTATGLWVKSVTELGSTFVQVAELASTFDMRQRPYRSKKDLLTAGVAGAAIVPAPGGGGGGGGATPMVLLPSTVTTESSSVTPGGDGTRLLVSVHFTAPPSGRVLAMMNGSLALPLPGGSPDPTASYCQIRLALYDSADAAVLFFAPPQVIPANGILTNYTLLGTVYPVPAYYLTPGAAYTLAIVQGYSNAIGFIAGENSMMLWDIGAAP